MNLTRRQFVTTALSTTAISILPGCSVTQPKPNDPYYYKLTAEPSFHQLVSGVDTDILGFNGQIPAPTLIARQGVPITIEFTNKLSEPTTIHWHGLRIPIEMDGVPFLSQPPIMPGETFVYRFTPPDAGTFWYHPHMNSVVQLGKGLVGAIVVEEATPVKFDDEHTLILKHWHIDKQGQWKDLMVPRLSARMGTPGEYGTVNGEHKPTYTVPENGSIRLRVANVDNTMTYPLAIEGAEAWIIAIDGNPITTPRLLTQHKMGPGMRVDLAIIAPTANSSFQLVQKKGKYSFTLCQFTAAASSIVSPATIPALPLNPVPQLDLDNAITEHFVFEWEGAVTPADKAGKGKYQFWLTNRRAWEGMSANNIPAPLATLELDKTYIFDLKNNTQYHHPIHLHGHTFTVLELDGQPVEPFHTDTVLLGKYGRAKAAFVADNPGRWMYHCHVIEHMKTGLMGYISVV